MAIRSRDGSGKDTSADATAEAGAGGNGADDPVHRGIEEVVSSSSRQDKRSILTLRQGGPIAGLSFAPEGEHPPLLRGPATGEASLRLLEAYRLHSYLTRCWRAARRATDLGCQPPGNGQMPPRAGQHLA
jgi:hypothetical protein